MADSFLRRWFGGPRAAPPSVEEARAELDRVAADRPALQPLLSWLRDLLPDLAPGAAPPLSLTAEEAHANLTGGMPLLRGQRIDLDPKAFRQRWRRVCGALEARQPDGVAAALAEALGHGRLEPDEMVEAVLAGRPEGVRGRAEAMGLDAGLTATVLRFTLFPLFVALEAQLAPLREGAAWEQGYCPICGGWPLLGEFRGLDQSRFLRCGLCAAGWEVRRQWCPFCGNRDHEGLGYLHGEGEETKYRAACCDACRGYVKMLSTLSALPPLHLLIADAATLHLDLAAAERGYTNDP
ncbi:MAG TPA: formate dehydrogenase accessory protein FdhE [Gemmataceae bacterium]|nr:formate dehydrogenase accessory protein FdhE [Gemmataceae bacterium]